MNRITFLSLSTALLTLPAIAPATAQVAPQTEAADTASAKPAADRANGEADIVVTALRRDTTLQETPISITAVTGNTLQQLGATGVQDYFRQIPNLNLNQGAGGLNRVSIRGINAAGEATVGLYYDETPITGPNGTTQDAGSFAADLNLFDVERVEVLRGPQGTLYGASSMAGTLRVIFNKPDSSRREAAFESQVSDTKNGGIGFFTRAMVNEPLIQDVLALRLVGYHEQRSGYIDNTYYGYDDVNESRANGIRAQLGFTPTDRLTINATAIYQQSTNDSQQGWFAQLGRYQSDQRVLFPFESEFQLYNLTGKWDMGGVMLTVTGSHYKQEILRVLDFTPSYVAISNSAASCRSYYGFAAACTAAQQATFRDFINGFLPVSGPQPAYVSAKNAEVRLGSTGSGPFQWTVGGFYEDRSDHIDSNTSLADPSTGITYEPYRNRAYRFVATNTKQKAVFADLSYTLFDALTLTAGTRYYEYDKRIEGQNLQGDRLFNSFAGAFSQVDADAKGWIHKFNVSYQASRDIMIYASAAKGFRPGGANNIPTLPSTLVAYRPDSLWNYETGVKTSWANGRVTANLSVFQIDWSDMQVAGRTIDGLFSFNTNAGAARIRGGEFELTVRPVRGLQLNAAAGYSDGKLTEDQASSTVLLTGTSGRAGDRLPGAPAWTASASALYTRPISDKLDLMMRADYAYTGKINSGFRPLTDPYFETYGDYGTIGGRIGIENDGAGVYLFVQNLTDTAGITGATSGVGIERLLFSIPPRTIGLNTRISF